MAARLKRERASGGQNEPVLRGKTLAILFALPSLRTRVSFEVAMAHLGGSSTYLAWGDVIPREPLEDAARNLSRWVDGIGVRHTDDEAIARLAEYASVPVINGLSRRGHPCQALADIFTIGEHFGALAGVTVVFVGDGNNVAQSLMLAASMVGMHTIVATPPEYAPEPAVVDRAETLAADSGGTVTLTSNVVAAVGRADVIYTDVWTSMGQEDEAAARRAAFRDYQVNASLLARAKSGAKVMHCQPAHRDEEITSEVLDSPASIVFDQAENRMNVQKAILAAIL